MLLLQFLKEVVLCTCRTELCRLLQETLQKRVPKTQCTLASEYAVGMALEDTTSSVRRAGTLPGSSSTISTRAPNTAYTQRSALTRAGSASSGLRRGLRRLLGFSLAQRHVVHDSQNKPRKVQCLVHRSHCRRNSPCA